MAQQQQAHQAGTPPSLLFYQVEPLQQQQVVSSWQLHQLLLLIPGKGQQPLLLGTLIGAGRMSKALSLGQERL
jgi:hypothetical protein